MILKILKLTPKAQEIKYATPHSAGLDLTYPYQEKILLQPGARQLISSGIAIEIPNNYEAQIRSRSGFAYKFGIIVLNSPATIDADYRGEIKILLYNTSQENFIIIQNMRIAQLVISPIIKPKIEYVTELSQTERGKQGFGSTGFYNKTAALQGLTNPDNSSTLS